MRQRFREIFVASIFVACAACAPDAHESSHPHEHSHASETHAERRTDAHHVAENRPTCEDDVELPNGALERYGIEVAPVAAVALMPTVSAPGHLIFPEGAVARVGSAVAGRVVEVRVQSGAEVAVGTPLVVVESPALGEAQSAYLQKKIVAATATPAVELARSAYERAKQLYDSVQGVALSEVQRRESELRALEGQRDIARADEAAAMHRLRLFGMHEDAIRELEASGKVEPRFALTAPIAGRVVEISVTLGELVDATKDDLLVLGDVSKLWAVAEVSESRLSEIVLGAPARVRVPAVEQAAYVGRVSSVPVTLEASTRTAEVRIEVPNPGGKLLPGMFIQVEIDSTRGAGVPVLAVPDAAVLKVEGKPSVFVPIAPGSSVFCKHEIEIGVQVGEFVPVLAGLAAGDLVVVSGAFRLKAEHGKETAEHDH
jgi:cobalt-zinc-cadmium efflux system membrane fusion protein